MPYLISPDLAQLWAYQPKGSYNTLTATYQTPTETMQATPTSLPTSKPASPQKTVTVATNHLPTLSPSPNSINYMIAIFLSGKNTDASLSRTVSYEIQKNSQVVFSGTSPSITAGNYWGITAFIKDIVVGDQISIYLWASATTVNWDYDAFSVQFYRCLIDYNKLWTTCVLTTKDLSLTALTGRGISWTTKGISLYSMGVLPALSDVASGIANFVWMKDKTLETTYQHELVFNASSNANSCFSRNKLLDVMYYVL